MHIKNSVSSRAVQAQLDFFSTFAPDLYDAGYSPIPLDGKRPVQRRWNADGITAVSVAAQCHRYPTANVGVRTGAVLACDIDITDPPLAQEVAAAAHEMLGPAPTRIGQSPKRAMFYRAEVPGKKQRVGKVEILGLGQQVAVYGVHPGIKEPYHWLGNGLVETPFDVLPVAANIDQFLDVCAKLQGIEPPQSDIDITNTVGHRDDALYRHLLRVAMETETLDALNEDGHNFNREKNVPPLPDAQVNRTVNSVWRYKEQGRLFMPGQQVVMGRGDVLAALEHDMAAYTLYGVLRRTRATSTFTIPQRGTAKELGCSPYTIRRAIKKLLDLGHLEDIGTRPSGNQNPAILYRLK